MDWIREKVEIGMLLDGFEEPPASYRGGVVTFGNFDGVHRGHSRLLASLRSMARQFNAPAIAISFDPHPLALIRPDSAPPALCSRERKEWLLLAGGADGVITYRATRQLLGLTAREFFDQIVVERLGAKGIIEGPNFGFGKNRSGNIEVLREFCRQANVAIQVVPIVTGGGEVISSTGIRRALEAGNVSEARSLLGRPHRLTGTVVAGDRRGRQLGFPTANLADVAALIPKIGVYAVSVPLGDRRYTGACNIGPNPTFGVTSSKVEVHLLDFEGDLYGASLDVDLLARLRDTRPFAGVDELKTQLGHDIQRARETFAAEPASESNGASAAGELSRTITQWLRQEIEPALCPLGIHLEQARLNDAGCLSLQWSPLRGALPSDVFELILRLEDRLRAVFPEVQRVESSAARSSTSGGSELGIGDPRTK